MSSKKYSQDQVDFLVNYIPGHHYKEIADAFNARFDDRKVTPNKVANFAKNRNIKTGFTGRFEKGMTSYNKGLKIYEYMSPEAIERSKVSRFKKGSVPANYKPVGSERITTDGYCDVKLDNGRWEQRARLVWEQHNGAIPEGCVILHRDQDKLNDNIDNLVLLTRNELQLVNKLKLTTDNLDLNNSAISLAQLMIKIKELENR